MPSPLVASPGASPELAQAFAEGARTGASAYQQKINEENAAKASEAATAEQIAAEQHQLQNQYALKAYEFQQKAAQTKSQNYVEFNKAHWDNVTGTYLSNLAEKQANAEKWLDPNVIKNITPESAKQARALVTQVQDIYQHVKGNTPVDFSTYHEPADLLNSKPLTATFTPEFTSRYQAKLQAESDEAVSKAKIEEYKASNPGASDADARWYAHHAVERQDKLADEEYKDKLGEKKAFDKNFGKAKDDFSANYGQLQSMMHGPVNTESLTGTPQETQINKTNAAAAKYSAHISDLGSMYPDYSGVSALWNKNKAKYNGLSTYQDIDAFMNDQVAKVKGAPADDPEVQATIALYGFIYGGNGQ